MQSCWQPKKRQRARLKTSKYLRGVNRRLAKVKARPLVAVPEHVAEQALQHTRVEHTQVEHTRVQRLALALRWVRHLLHHSWLQSRRQQCR